MKFIGTILLALSTLSAAETAVLVDGSRIVAERHENAGGQIRLYTQSGPREVPAEDIQFFEDGVILDVPPALPVATVAVQLPVPLKPEDPPKPLDPNALIRAAASKHKVPVAMVKSIMAAESNFNPNAVSPKGALGLMQVMPSTARQFGLDASQPEQNVDAGTRYLRYLIDKYQHYRDWLRRVIAAYNAGPGAVDKYRGVPPYPETKTYVARVLSFLKQYRNDL